MKFRGVDLAFIPALTRLALIQRGETPPPLGDVEGRRNRASGMGPFLAGQFGNVPLVTISDMWVEGDRTEPLRIRVYQPTNRRVPTDPTPAILHIHGGGMIMSTVEAYDQRCSAYAHATGYPVFSVDYRLAPEHPYPAAHEDCFDTYLWMQNSAADLGIDPERIALLGNSAGSGLAAALALRIRDLKLTPPRCQVLIYPMLDHRTTTPGPGWERTWLYWDFQDNQTAWEAYLGELSGEDPPVYAVPALASDLRGLPDTYICVGTADIFFTEDLEFAARLEQAGVPTELHVVEGAPHNFDYLSPHCPASRDSWRSRFEYLVRTIQD
ncbi:MAG: alpha/beta hydrolase [Candidatus Nanopelagicales bacterium]|nr:alpha/beta hydrolase [Candidatus Nanopelagicales bacterium]